MNPSILTDASNSTNLIQGQKYEQALIIDPFLRLKIEKLETALKILGLEPTVEQQYEMRHRLNVDSDDTVAYGDFVALAREIFTPQLVKIKSSDILARTGNKSNLSTDFVDNSSLLVTSTSGIELSLMNREKERMKTENEKLKALLQQKDMALKIREDEILQVREELQMTVEECRSLKSRLHLAKEAQKAARNTEHDYEDVLQVLEAELTQLRHQEMKLKEDPDVQKRLLEMSYNLRKTEVEKRMYQVATEKLIQFAMSVSSHLESIPHTITTAGDKKIKETEECTNSSHSFAVHLFQFIASEARNTMKAVKCLLESETLQHKSELTSLHGEQKHYTNLGAHNTSKNEMKSPEICLYCNKHQCHYCFRAYQKNNATQTLEKKT